MSIQQKLETKRNTDYDCPPPNRKLVRRKITIVMVPTSVQTATGLHERIIQTK